MFDNYVEHFVELGVNRDEAIELNEILKQKSKGTGVSVNYVFACVSYTIMAFKPHTKIGDWMDIFR